MTVETQQTAAGAGDHVVQFYDRESELAQTVGSHLAGGVEAGGVAIIIATEAHRAAFTAALEAEQIEVSPQFPAELASPRAARRFVADALRRGAYCGTLLDDAQLVVSELATNAVVHAGSPFSVVARFEKAGVRLSVHDGSRVEPRIEAKKHGATSGRGLHVIAALTHQWGVLATNDGKVVWAELRR